MKHQEYQLDIDFTTQDKMCSECLK